MGTSASSKGPGAGVSFDPPWLDEAGGFEPSETVSSPEEIPENGKSDEKVDPLIAPPARFLRSRSWLGKYAREKLGRSGFEKAAGHYSASGMGGAAKLASRMRHSTATGARLAGFLTSTSSQTDAVAKAWVKEIVDRGLSGQEVIDAIVQQVAPSGGSRDEESSVDSMARALGEFIEKNEDSDLLTLEASDIREITERYLANEACNRLTNDIGQVFEGGAISLRDSLSLLKEMREYLRADLSVQIESLWKVNASPTHLQLDQVLKTAVQRTFEVYEGEI